MGTFKAELTALINKHSLERGSNTPDYILADYLCRCLVMYQEAIKLRDMWLHNPSEPEGTDFKEVREKLSQ